MQFILLVAVLGLVRCDRDETKSRRCKGHPSASQLAQLAQDAHQLLGFAREELHTTATEHTGGVKRGAVGMQHATGMRHAGTQRKSKPYPQQQGEYDEHNSEVSGGALALSEDDEGLDEQGQDLGDMVDAEDRDLFTNEGAEVMEDNFGSADADEQLAEGFGDQLGAARRNAMLGMEHKTEEVTRYNSLGEDMKRRSGRLGLGNSSEGTTGNPDTGFVISTTPHLVKPNEDIDDIEVNDEIDEVVSTTTSLTKNGQPLENMPVDKTGGSHFYDLKSKQTELKEAHEQLQQVATQASKLAMKTYKDINAYQQTVEDLHGPVHDVARQVHQLHSKFEENIRLGEVERLQAWTDLDQALIKAGVINAGVAES